MSDKFCQEFIKEQRNNSPIVYISLKKRNFGQGKDNPSTHIDT